MAKIHKNQILDENFTNWDTAFSWGDHALAGYLTSFTETNDLTASVTWANIPDANVPVTAVTQHQAAISITESQISDLGSYAAASHTHTTSDITNLASYTGFDARYYTETEVDALTWDTSDIVSGTFVDARISQSSVTQHEAALTITESQISDLSHTSYTLSKSFTIPDPVDTDDATMFYTPVAITITATHSHITGGTNVVYNINHASTRTGTGLDVFTSDITETSTAGATHNTGFNDATIPAGSWVWLDIISISGTPTLFHVTLIYTED